jgi:N-acetylmuramoyl-L-alanine amidase
MSKLKIMLSSLICIAIFSMTLFAYDKVNVSINGYPKQVDARLINSTTYVKLTEMNRLLSESAGTSINVDAKAGNCYITARGRYLGGSDCLQINNSVYVPIRSIAKVYNAGVEWIGETNSVSLRLTANSGIEKGDDYYIADEVYWLSRIINAEAKGEPMRGKILVGNVILNRMFHKDFPNTIYDVIYDSKYGVQFTPIINGTIYEEPSAESVIAAKICLDAYYISREALYFLNPSISTSLWITSNRNYITSVGNHAFYS